MITTPHKPTFNAKTKQTKEQADREMTKKLQDFILEYIDIPEQDLLNITKLFKTKKFKKNEYILRQGNICKDFIYLQSGCTRLYYIKDGIEVSVWFAFPNSVASEIYSFIGQKPSDFFVQAVKECEILYISKTKLEKIYRTYPKMQEMMRKFWEDVLLHIIQRFSALQNDTAEERYLELLNNPYYLQTIPQKYLASFIGVTPTSLSRIRKNIR
ncbi:MAG: Crp/Fnr family transcriptional regulator [Agriterribacter sp.]